MERANDDWQRPLSQSLHDRIDTTLTQPLRAYVKSTFGNSLSVWDSPPSLTPYPKAAPHAAALT